MTIHAKYLALDAASAAGAAPAPTALESCGRIPAVAIHAFCRTPALLDEMTRALSDRRMSRVDPAVFKGGVEEAIEFYRQTPNPNVILLDTDDGEDLFAQLELLAEVCNVTTRLILIGRSNDIDMYRALKRRGVTEYLRQPLTSAAIVAAIAEIFEAPSAAKVGRVYAFVGARGGVGSSTLAHNLAWTLAGSSAGSVILADLDLPFGTAALDFDINPTATLAEAARHPERLDDQMLDRLLTSCGENMSILSAPATLDLQDAAEAPAFGKLLDLAQAAASHVVLDIPHVWSEWTRQALVAADEVVITATPDLASLRNTANLLDVLRRSRPHDREPCLVLNQVGVPKRPEIKAKLFSETLGLEPAASIAFDPRSFGTASNTGRMLQTVRGGSRYLPIMQQLAERLVGAPLSSRRPGRLARLLGRSAR